MINSPFVHFQTREQFEKMKSNIQDKSLVFIKDTNEIYSNNTTYSSFEILENTELSKNTLTPIAKINGQELKLKVESDKMDTTDNITITDIGQINPNYKNQYLEYKTITTQTMAFNGKPVIFGEYFVLVKNSSGGVCSVTIPVVSDTTFICTTNDVKIQPADSILFKIKTYDGQAVVDYEYLYDEPYQLLTKTITSTVYDNREYQAGETIAVQCEVTSVYVNRLSNEEITATAWHDVEVTAPDSSGSVEIEADGAKDSLSVEVAVSAYYKVDLNSQWQSSSKSNPDSSLYEGVYESFSNYNVGNTAAIMYITISGYSDFTLYIRSYAESSYDYVMVSHLDQTISNSTTSSSSLVKAHTSGNQQSGTALSSYTKVEFTDIEEGEHKITIVYRKDSSVNSGDDKGYILISKNNTIAETTPEETPDVEFSGSCDNYFMIGYSTKSMDLAIESATNYENYTYGAAGAHWTGYVYLKGRGVKKIKLTAYARAEPVMLSDNEDDIMLTDSTTGTYFRVIESNNQTLSSLDLTIQNTDTFEFEGFDDEFYAYCYVTSSPSTGGTVYITGEVDEHVHYCTVDGNDITTSSYEVHESGASSSYSKSFTIKSCANRKVLVNLDMSTHGSSSFYISASSFENCIANKIDYYNYEIVPTSDIPYQSEFFLSSGNTGYAEGGSGALPAAMIGSTWGLDVTFSSEIIEVEGEEECEHYCTVNGQNLLNGSYNYYSSNADPYTPIGIMFECCGHYKIKIVRTAYGGFTPSTTYNDCEYYNGYITPESEKSYSGILSVLGSEPRDNPGETIDLTFIAEPI